MINKCNCYAETCVCKLLQAWRSVTLWYVRACTKVVMFVKVVLQHVCVCVNIELSVGACLIKFGPPVRTCFYVLCQSILFLLCVFKLMILLHPKCPCFSAILNWSPGLYTVICHGRLIFWILTSVWLGFGVSSVEMPCAWWKLQSN